MKTEHFKVITISKQSLFTFAIYVFVNTADEAFIALDFHAKLVNGTGGSLEFMLLPHHSVS